MDITGDCILILYIRTENHIKALKGMNLELCFDSLRKNVFIRRYDSHNICFYQIEISEEEIQFQTNSTYFIVYSKKRPSYPYKGYGNYRDDFVDRIGFNWYQVISDAWGIYAG